MNTIKQNGNFFWKLGLGAPKFQGLKALPSEPKAFYKNHSNLAKVVFKHSKECLCGSQSL